MHPFSTQRGHNTIPNLAPALRCHSIVSPGLHMPAILADGLMTLVPGGRTAMLLIRQHTHSFHLDVIMVCFSAGGLARDEYGAVS